MTRPCLTVIALLLAGSLDLQAADTPSGEEFGTSYPDAGAGYDAPGTYSNQPYAPPAAAPAASGWSGQSSAPSNGGYGASGKAYGAASGAYGSSAGYGGAQAGGVQGGSFKGRGTPQGGGTTNPYASGKTFTRKPKTPVDASAFGGGSSGSVWPEAGEPTPAPSPY